MQTNTMILIPRCVQPQLYAKTARIYLMQGCGGILSPDIYSMYSAKANYSYKQVPKEAKIVSYQLKGVDAFP